MKVAVVSDIHANRHAFEAVLDDVHESETVELWCLGDVVGYGAEPDACVELAREHAAVCLAGNHDLAVAGELDLDEFSTGARVAAEWTREVLDPEHARFLAKLTPSGREHGYALYHASPRDPIWEYVTSALQADLCMDVQADRVSFVGHTHIALAYQRPEASSATGDRREDGDILDLSRDEWLINPGSVGQPRDNDPRAAWLELDTELLTARFHRVDYDIQGAAGAIRAARLPDSLAERLEHGC